MASMLEGGGKTPMCTPAELESMGFKLVAYPLSLLGVSIAAQQAALRDLKAGKVPPADSMASFADIQRVVGFDSYFAAADRFAAAAAVNNCTAAAEPATGNAAVNESVNGATSAVPDAAAMPAAPAIEADEIIAPAPMRGSSSSSSTNQGDTSSTAIEDLFRRAKFFRLRIEDARSGKTKLETRFPAGFMNQLATFVPEVAGLRLEDLIASVRGKEGWHPGQPVLDFEAGGGDRVLVYLEEGGT